MTGLTSNTFGVGNFDCLYLGVVPNVSIMPATENVPGNGSRRTDPDPTNGQASSRSIDVQLIDRMDNAQLEGRIPYAGTNETHGVTLTVSKHGLKITESPSRGGNVIERVPLHTVAQAISYNDGWGRWNLAIKAGQVGKNQFSCYVFQTQTEAEAATICQSIRQIFDRIRNSD